MKSGLKKRETESYSHGDRVVMNKRGRNLFGHIRFFRKVHSGIVVGEQNGYCVDVKWDGPGKERGILIDYIKHRSSK